MKDMIMGIISVIGTLSSILFAYLAFRKNDRTTLKDIAKSEGALLSDIGYIKSSIDRMESKLDRVEVNYEDLLTRVTRLEEKEESLEKRIANMKGTGNGIS